MSFINILECLERALEKKAESNRELWKQYERLDNYNTQLLKENEMLRKDLKELSIQFTTWKSKREKDELKKK
jgi:DNA phosphorothioation-dependent restriction protein DptG